MLTDKKLSDIRKRFEDRKLAMAKGTQMRQDDRELALFRFESHAATDVGALLSGVDELRAENAAWRQFGSCAQQEATK
jgi:hypothetical protein